VVDKETINEDRVFGCSTVTQPRVLISV